MLRISFLRNILLISLVLAAVLPLCQVLVIHPAYQDLLTEETEQEAIRYVSYLARTLHLDQVSFERGKLPAEVVREVGHLQGDVHLVKLRFFDAGGTITFSTEAQEIGTVNRKDYFQQIVAQGRNFSKVVQKDALTADGQKTRVDVVETYVPIMDGGRFAGAVETYYDITASRQKFDSLSTRTLILLVVICLALLTILWVVLGRAGRDMRGREVAEEALRRSHADLEERVAARTEELLQVNQQLSREIADRSRAQQVLARTLREMREDKEKIDGIIRSVAEGLLVTNAAGKLVMINPAAERLLGVNGQWRQGQPMGELTGEPVLNETLAALVAAGAGSSRELELNLQGPASPTVVQARTSAICDQGGERTGLITVLHDVTHERNVERLKSEFISMAAHELQTPLTAIIGYSELLLEDGTGFSDEERGEFLTYIHDKAEALGRIVRDLLDISRVESGRILPLDRTDFPVAGLIERMVDQYRKRHPRHRFETELAEEDLLVHADRNRVAQVLENLLSNAVKYSAGGLVRVSGTRQKDHYLITVQDEGIGMTPEQVTHIFDKFYRVDNSNTAAAGIGLGMSIARYMVEAHGGRIWVESEPGRGTVVHFTLPEITDERIAPPEPRVTERYSFL